jgi:hypothetical protein
MCGVTCTSVGIPWSRCRVFGASQAEYESSILLARSSHLLASSFLGLVANTSIGQRESPDPNPAQLPGGPIRGVRDSQSQHALALGPTGRRGSMDLQDAVNRRPDKQFSIRISALRGLSRLMYIVLRQILDQVD